jgi:hypothetical protein
LTQPLNLQTNDIDPVFVKKSGNSLAFAAGSEGELFFATPSLYPELKAHMVHLSSDGAAVDMPKLSYDEIVSADVDGLDRLSLLTRKESFALRMTVPSTNCQLIFLPGISL